MSFTVSPIWSWATVSLTTVALLALVLLTYPKRVRHLSPATRRILLAMRIFGVVILAVAMVRPAVEWAKTDDATATVFLGIDTSRSMTTEDAAGDVARFTALQQTLAECETQLSAMNEQFKVRLFQFSREMEEVESFADAKPDGDMTALGHVLESVLDEAELERTLAVYLLSDGAQRAVRPLDADPRQVVRRFAEQQIAINTVGFGGSGLTDAGTDVAVEDLLIDPLVFEKKTVPISLQLRAVGAAGRSVVVRVLVEDRSGKRIGESGELVPLIPSGEATTTAEVRITGNSSRVPVELSFKPDRPGEYKVAVEAIALDGEVLTRNNRRETIITVQRGGVNVAYIDTLRPEQKYLRVMNRAEQIQVDFQPVKRIPGERAPLDPSWFEPGRFDIYILGDVSAGALGKNVVAALADRVSEGAGFAMIGGFHTFGAGGYATTPLADVLPVAMNRNEAHRLDQVDAHLHIVEDVNMLPTERGLRHYLMRIDSPSKNRERWMSLPPLAGANRLVPKNEFVEVLAVTPDQQPLLVAHQVGPARVVAFAGDSTRLWYAFGHEDVHQRFWRQLILWLAHKEQDGDDPVWVNVTPRNYEPRALVPITMGARTEDGLPISDADFEVTVTAPDGETFQPATRAVGNEVVAEFRDTAQAGDYWVNVTATKDGEPIGFGALTRFIVDAKDVELDNPAADHDLLEELAAFSGGVNVAPEQLMSVLSRMLEEGLANSGFSKVHRLTIWDNWGLLGVFALTMIAEWFVRKRRGLV